MAAAPFLVEADGAPEIPHNQEGALADQLTGKMNPSLKLFSKHLLFIRQRSRLFLECLSSSSMVMTSFSWRFLSRTPPSGPGPSNHEFDEIGLNRIFFNLLIWCLIRWVEWDYEWDAPRIWTHFENFSDSFWPLEGIVELSNKYNNKKWRWDNFFVKKYLCCTQ